MFGGLSLNGREDQRENFRALVESLDDPVLAPRPFGVGTAQRVKFGFLGDELTAEEPVDLIPCGGNIGGDGLAEDVTNCPHEVVADNRILVRLDPQ